MIGFFLTGGLFTGNRSREFSLYRVRLRRKEQNRVDNHKQVIHTQRSNQNRRPKSPPKHSRHRHPHIAINLIPFIRKGNLLVNKKIFTNYPLIPGDQRSSRAGAAESEEAAHFPDESTHEINPKSV
jgi:hypothetical protein